MTKSLRRRIVLGLSLVGFWPAVANAQVVDQQLAASGYQAPALPVQEAAAWQAVLSAYDVQEWLRMRDLLGEQPDSPLKGFLLAEMYTAAGSPRTEAAEIEAWLTRYTSLPQAEQMLRLGRARGLSTAFELPARNPLVRVPAISKRMRPPAVADGTMPPDIAASIQEHIKNDDPDSARLLLDGVDAALSAEARAEWRQRVAWSYYIENRDTAALAMALSGRDGSGAWVAESDWTVGLAAWRLGDCGAALDGFARAARGAADKELRSAANYWASRSATRCRRPADAARFLKQASQYDETLYGMLAREQLGQSLPSYQVAAFSPEDWQTLRHRPGPQLAISLARLGRDSWASKALQHEVLTGEPRAFAALSRLARQLNLPRTQVWMGMNVPRGATPDPALRYPVTGWRPVDGWRIDPALAFAHVLQESDFDSDAVSPAAAVGLMQVRQIAARDVAGRTQLSAQYADLKDPATNLTFGQSNLEKLSEAQATRGHLPKVIAAYNAGLTPVTRWNREVRDGGDPLLYMESLPFWETRGYASTVLRNYWMYLRQRQDTAPSRTDLAQNRWPLFPSRPARAETQ